MIRSLFLIFFLSLSIAWAKEDLVQTSPKAHPALVTKIKEWLLQLEKSSQAEKAQESLERLGQITLPFVYSYLGENKNPKTKRKLIQIIETIDSYDSHPILLDHLTNRKEDSRVREQAAITLANFTQEKKVREALAKYAFHRDVRISRACVHALCKFPRKTSIPILISILKHWEKSLAYKAQETLVQVTQKKDLSNYEGWKKWWLDYKDIFTISE